jgi:peptidoglycan-associated lipoprotein
LTLPPCDRKILALENHINREEHIKFLTEKERDFLMKRNMPLFVVIAVVCIPAISLMSGCSLFKKKSPEIKPVPIEKPQQARAETESRPTIQPAPAELTPIRPSGLPRDASSVLKTIYFDFDKSNIRPDQQPVLEANARYLLEHPGIKILIEGHCDERGTIEYNFALGDRRATETKGFLATQGVSPDRIATLSKGEEEPADPGHNEEAWAKNRRAVFKFME